MEIFVTGGSGFIGTVFVRHALAEGHRVRVLTRSETSGERIRALGAEPVTGDLLQAGPWQDEAARAEGIVHLAQPETYGARVSKSRAENYRAQRLQMDSLLLDALRPDVVQRILYIAGTSYYGDQGLALHHEDTPSGSATLSWTIGRSRRASSVGGRPRRSASASACVTCRPGSADSFSDRS